MLSIFSNFNNAIDAKMIIIGVRNVANRELNHHILISPIPINIVNRVNKTGKDMKKYTELGIALVFSLNRAKNPPAANNSKIGPEIMAVAAP